MAKHLLAPPALAGADSFQPTTIATVDANYTCVYIRIVAHAPTMIRVLRRCSTGLGVDPKLGSCKGERMPAHHQRRVRGTVAARHHPGLAPSHPRVFWATHQNSRDDICRAAKTRTPQFTGTTQKVRGPRASAAPTGWPRRCWPLKQAELPAARYGGG